jgi:hypothetical protein
MFEKNKTPRGPKIKGQRWKDGMLDQWRAEAGYVESERKTSREW